jgi:hypothetical protein
MAGHILYGGVRYRLFFIAAFILIAAALFMYASSAAPLQVPYRHPLIIPDANDPWFAKNVNSALDYLDSNYPENYSDVTTWLGTIEPTDTYTRVTDSGVCYICQNDWDGNPIWLASVLIHEARHVEDDHSARPPHDDAEAEERALTCQSVFLGSVNSWDAGQEKSWVDGYMKTRYWEIIPAKYPQ